MRIRPAHALAVALITTMSACAENPTSPTPVPVLPSVQGQWEGSWTKNACDLRVMVTLNNRQSQVSGLAMSGEFTFTVVINRVPAVDNSTTIGATLRGMTKSVSVAPAVR